MAKYPKELRPLPTPKKVNSWDRPAPQMECGDDTDSITYEAIGRALTRWENFECELVQLFATFVGRDPSSAPATRAYGSVQSFRGRADMVEAAAEAFFRIFPDQAIEKNVSSLMDEARGFSARRNEIAHGVVGTPVWGNGKRGGGLFPPMYATNKNELLPVPKDGEPWNQKMAYGYTSKEINAFAKHFQRLEDDMELLRHAVILHRSHAEKKKKGRP